MQMNTYPSDDAISKAIQEIMTIHNEEEECSENQQNTNKDECIKEPDDIENEIYKMLMEGNIADIRRYYSSFEPEIKAAIISYSICVPDVDPNDMYNRCISCIDSNQNDEEIQVIQNDDVGDTYETVIPEDDTQQDVPNIISDNLLSKSRRFYHGWITLGMTDGRNDNSNYDPFAEPPSEQNTQQTQNEDSDDDSDVDDIPRPFNNTDSIGFDGFVNGSQPQVRYDNQSPTSSPMIQTKQITQNSLSENISLGYANNTTPLRIIIPQQSQHQSHRMTLTPQPSKTNNWFDFPQKMPSTPPPLTDRQMYNKKKDELLQKHEEERIKLQEQQEQDYLYNVQTSQEAKDMLSDKYNKKLQKLLQTQAQEQAKLQYHYAQKQSELHERQSHDKLFNLQLELDILLNNHKNDENLLSQQHEQEQNELSELYEKELEKMISTGVNLKQKLVLRHRREEEDLKNRQEQELKELRESGRNWIFDSESDREEDRDRDRHRDFDSKDRDRRHRNRDRSDE